MQGFGLDITSLSPTCFVFIFHIYRVGEGGHVQDICAARHSQLANDLAFAQPLAPQFTADGRFMASKHTGDFCSIASYFQQCINLVLCFCASCM